VSHVGRNSSSTSVCELRIVQYIRQSPEDVTPFKAKAVPLHAMKELGGRGSIAPTHSQPRYYMGGKGPPVPIVQEAGWVPEPVLDTEVRRKIFSLLPGIEPRSPGRPARSQTLY
jgi:hypothetical protein